MTDDDKLAAKLLEYEDEVKPYGNSDPICQKCRYFVPNPDYAGERTVFPEIKCWRFKCTECSMPTHDCRNWKYVMFKPRTLLGKLKLWWAERKAVCSYLNDDHRSA